MSRRAIIVAYRPHHNVQGGMFCDGLRRRGWTADVSTSPQPCDLLVLWGVKDRQHIRAQHGEGGEVCILERGYLGDRMRNTSVSFGGGLNGRGCFSTPWEPDLSRFHALGLELNPWVSRPFGPAVIMGQVPGDQSLRNIDFEDWARRTAADLVALGYPVRFRQHPGAMSSRVAVRASYGARSIDGTLQEVLAQARLVVTWNSNSGVDAVLAGVPTVAMDAGSMVRTVAAHDIQETTPDRTAWAARLSWCQFTDAELSSGFAQEVVGL
jgi:hypothetical protein